MKRSYAITISEYNQMLSDSGQTLIIVSWMDGRLELSNGVVLNTHEIRSFRGHVKSPMLCPHIDNLYTIGVVDRVARVKAIQQAWASKKNTEYWNNLDPATAEQKRDHMRRIQSAVDRSVIVYPEPWNKGKNKTTDPRLAKTSAGRTGDKNPMYGHRWPEEYKLEKSVLLKQRIANGDWTPHVHNSRTHWNSSHNGKQYRSSWEAMYASLNPEDQYEMIRIPYMFANKQHTYIVDFVNQDTQTLTEIKPSAQSVDPKVIAKIEAANIWCNDRGYTFRVVGEDYFVDNFDKIPFDELCIPNIREKISKIKNEARKQNSN